ncbi:MAG TPA: hypothetical protein VJT49_16670 [Amycolatopsis sp.]|uniref:hypothetical protein n=1 Tax=Amycolatopsis sp. TaxID=37632 RepID=UPI002B4930FE|nr:hypothetical protein [Amycolatopsis sp.]HKS46708.1 hypothetical protein [Amycolatopsis sp.]
MAGWISAEQQKRDHNGQRYICCACGNEGTGKHALVVNKRGMRVHKPVYDERIGRDNCSIFVRT